MLTDTKIYVGKYGSEIQEKAFRLGWYWPLKTKKEEIRLTTDYYAETNIQMLLDPFIYFHANREMECGSNLRFFNNSDYREITFEELMAMKPKYSNIEDIGKKLIELRDKIDCLLNNY